ncbi:uncharacterized protein [Drosophila kikkawai]|uniref:Uncharacterized protein n=1 Tax=Drosophila kikkawai TaxID=30033 RepID=A0A6P4I5U2_DROKI|nr:uncharacterized protein LOC108072540 [Drosophila kikkawai]KAH8351682.1 hypothetical protein KR059_011873 [Drosophila kikkawai]
MNKLNKEWSRAVPFKPKDNLTTEAKNRAAKFVSSIETDCVPVSMACLIGWEYARIWLRDRDNFVKKRNKAVKAKFIKNDFESWLNKRKTPKRNQKF